MPLLLATLLALGAPAEAHPGHGSTVVIGTLLSVTPDAITIETRDVATATMKTVRVLVTEDTRYREGKTPVTDVTPYLGGRAIAGVDFEEGPAGGTIYRALDVRLSKPTPKQ
ncbi:MAG: hypothetical protein R2745_01290 [Vicinamibacterales bacterium]